LQIFYQSQFPELSDTEVNQLINEIDSHRLGRYVNSQITDGRVDSDMFRTAFNNHMGGDIINSNLNVEPVSTTTAGAGLVKVLMVIIVIICSFIPKCVNENLRR